MLVLVLGYFQSEYFPFVSFASKCVLSGWFPSYFVPAHLYLLQTLILFHLELNRSSFTFRFLTLLSFFHFFHFFCFLCFFLIAKIAVIIDLFLNYINVFIYFLGLLENMRGIKHWLIILLSFIFNIHIWQF